jgi:hypothetical protein
MRLFFWNQIVSVYIGVVSLNLLFKEYIMSKITHVGKFSRDEIIILMDQMLSRNEANDAVRYVLSKAPIAKSGYTFGRCQHDCGQRSDARDFIQACLERANVAGKKIQNIISKLANYTLSLSDSELEIVNNALSLPENIAAINQFDIAHMEAAIDHVAKIASEYLKGEIGKKVKDQILDNPKLFLQLVDYHNQFYLGAEGPLVSFLNGESVDRSDLGIEDPVKINTSKLRVGLLSEVRRFINQYTTYGIEHRDDCTRRQETIDNLGYTELRPRPSPNGHPRRTPQPGPTTPIVVPPGLHPPHGKPNPPNPRPNPPIQPAPRRPAPPNWPGPFPRPRPNPPVPPTQPTPPAPTHPTPAPNPPPAPPTPPPRTRPTPPRPRPPRPTPPPPIPITPRPLPILGLSLGSHSDGAKGTRIAKQPVDSVTSKDTKRNFGTTFWRPHATSSTKTPQTKLTANNASQATRFLSSRLRTLSLPKTVISVLSVAATIALTKR